MTRFTTLLALATLTLAACSGEVDAKDGAADDDTMDETQVDDTEDDDTNDDDDCVVAPAPTDLTLTGHALPRQAPTARWTSPEGCDEVDHHELAIGTSKDPEAVLAWTDVGDEVEYLATEVRLSEGEDYVVSVRTVDTEGEVSEVTTSAAFQQWTPAVLNPTVWLDAAHNTYSDSSCTAPATAGDQVRCWVDRANGHQAKSMGTNDTGGAGTLMPISALQPVLVPAQPSHDAPVLLTTSDGAPIGVDFRGGMRLNIAYSTDFDASANLSYFVATTMDELPSNGVYDYFLFRDDVYEFAVTNGGQAMAINTLQNGAWAWSYGPFTFESGRHVFGFEHNDLEHHMWMDGTRSADPWYPAGSQTGTPVVSTAPIELGWRSDANHQQLRGDIGEMLLFATSPSEADLATLNTYLIQRWDIERLAIIEDTGAPLDTGWDGPVARPL